MIDARQVYRKVTRKIYDFSPEQLANLTAIVWLYRGQQERFLGLVKSYFQRTCAEAAQVPEALKPFNTTLTALGGQLEGFGASLGKIHMLANEKTQTLMDALAELAEAAKAYGADRDTLVKDLAAFVAKHKTSLPDTNKAQHTARQAFDPLAERLKGLIKQVDLIYKLCARVWPLAAEVAVDEVAAMHLDRRAASKRVKQLEEERKSAVEQLKHAAYFFRQIVWLQERFPKAEFNAVPGLCTAATLRQIEKADWSLTPGRYVGIASPEVDEDFDFEQALHDIHVELADLDAEASVLAAKIQENLEELGS